MNLRTYIALVARLLSGILPSTSQECAIGGGDANLGLIGYTISKMQADVFAAVTESAWVKHQVILAEHGRLRTVNEHFAHWLKGQLHDYDLEVSAIAALAGISAGYVSLLKEPGKRRASRKVVEDIARAIAKLRDVDEREVLTQACETAGYQPSLVINGAVRSRVKQELKLAKDCVTSEWFNIAMRPLEWLLQRESDSTEVWIIRSHTYFLSGFDEDVRRQMIHFLKSTDITYHFVFRDGGKPSRKKRLQDEPSINPAKDSFISFKKALLREEARNNADPLFNRVKGHPITSKDDMLALGLGVTYAATVILFYRDDVRNTVRRSFDVFSEMATEKLFPETNEPMDDSGYLAWHQVPKKRAQVTMKSWETILEKLRHEGDCIDSDEVQRYPDRLILHF